jgi:hypothetical protein
VPCTGADVDPRRRLRAVEGDQREALLLRARHEAGELERRARRQVPLPGDERLRVTTLKHPQCLLDAGTPELLGREAGLLGDLDELPAAPLAVGRERPPLRLECGAALVLPAAPHVPTRAPAAKLVPPLPDARLTPHTGTCWTIQQIVSAICRIRWSKRVDAELSRFARVSSADVHLGCPPRGRVRIGNFWLTDAG